MKSRLFALFAVVLAILAAALPPLSAFAAGSDERAAGLLSGVRVSPSVSAKSAVLAEVGSGEVLFEKNADERLPMASTTKIMTALVALEHAAPETVVTVPREAVGIEGSSIYLFEGEQLTLEELLWALLLASANDAAAAIAWGVAGGVEPFAALMNEKAAALGLRDTHFVNPHGLDDPDHYTTARELAIIARAALGNDLIRRMVATEKTTIPHNGTAGVRLLVNHNKLLRRYKGAIGVKTGYTRRSGRCLVSAAEREGVTLLAVTINAPSDWNDHAAMLNAGFAALTSVTLASPGGIAAEVPAVGGVAGSVTVANTALCRVTLPADHSQITAAVELPRFVYAPVGAGEAVGRVVWRMDGRTVAEVELLARTDVPATPKKAGWFRRLRDRIFHRN